MTVISKAESPRDVSYGRLTNSHLCRMPVDLSYLYSSSPPLNPVFAESFRAVLPPEDLYRYGGYQTGIFASPRKLLNRSPVSQTLRMLKPCLKTLQNDAPSPLPKSNSGGDVSYESDEPEFCMDKPVLRKQSSDPGSLLRDKKSKKVTFADAHGFTLTFVKYMTETTQEPPQWDILDDMVRSLKMSAKPSAPEDACVADKPKLVAKFEQPVANYLAFREKLEKNNVSLENVILKDLTSINGTIKARNIAFEKKIVVRVTYDGWKSFTDHDASYVKSIYGHEAFDTFQFNVAVPKAFDPIRQSVEFCVRYTTNEAEYWDNNSGKNYVVSTNVFAKNARVSLEEGFGEVRPNTYCELPSPQFNTWLEYENKGPFY